jgi:hypothetical protein
MASFKDLSSLKSLRNTLKAQAQAREEAEAKRAAEDKKRLEEATLFSRSIIPRKGHYRFLVSILPMNRLHCVNPCPTNSRSRH